MANDSMMDVLESFSPSLAMAFIAKPSATFSRSDINRSRRVEHNSFLGNSRKMPRPCTMSLTVCLGRSATWEINATPK